MTAFQDFQYTQDPEHKTDFGIVYFANVEKRDINDYAPFPLPSLGEIDEDDKRIVRSEEVPRIVFSEILAELDVMISG